MKDNVFSAYLRESLEEFHKVSWPTKNQAIRITAIVLIFSLVMAVFIAVFDFLFSYGFRYLSLL